VPVDNDDEDAVDRVKGGGEETSTCRDDSSSAELGSGGMDGKRRRLAVEFESLSDIPRTGVPVRDWG